MRPSGRLRRRRYGFNVTNAHLHSRVTPNPRFPLNAYALTSQFDPEVFAGATYRLFTVASHPHSFLFQVQRALFSRIAQKTNGVFVYPAIGLDCEHLPEQGNFVGISRDPSPLRVPKKDEARFFQVSKLVQELIPADIAEAQTHFGNPRDTILVLKGVHGLLDQREFDDMVNTVNPTHVVAFESPAVGNVPPSKFSPAEQRQIAAIHSGAHSTFVFNTTHYPGIRVRVFERRR